MNLLSEVLLKLINKLIDEKFNLFKVTCPHDCPDACSMEVEVDEVTKKVMKVSGEKSHPVTKGFLCNKVNNYIDLIYNKDRVLYPKIRVNSKQEKQAKWKRISWEMQLI